MGDYERGTPAWDLGIALTRHNDGITKGQNGTLIPCARVENILSTVGHGLSSGQRLDSALATECTCGAGDSQSEATSLDHVKEG